jgi:hypothetical protein
MRARASRVDPRDPDIRADGKCVVCKEPRPPLAVKHGDPFCSAACCRKSYHVKEKSST